MFLKPYKLKSNAHLKSTDVKKLRQRIQQEFPNTNPDILIPRKSSVNILKWVSHGDFQTNVYSVDKMPMFFENEEKKLVPTLYSLWQVQDLLPYLTTHAGVLPKLSNGADLMLPAVTPQGTGMSMYGHYKKGQLVGVNLTSNKSAVAVGYLPRSSDDLYMCGGHGVGVKILHVFGDKLWGHEPSLAQQVPQFKSKALESNLKTTIQKQMVEKQEDFSALVSKSITSKEPAKEIEVTQSEDNDVSEKIDLSTTETGTIKYTNDEEVTNEEFTPEFILKQAFLSALKNHGKTLPLPLLTSNFFRLYVVPEAQQTLDFKKTKYKKLSNFLNEMINQGFIVVREETKGIDKITSIDLEHPELVNFITDYKKTSDNPLFYSKLAEIYTVTDVTAPVFTKLNYKRGEGIAAAQIKKIIREYVNKQNLTISKDPQAEDKSYILDECLQKICNSKMAPLSRITNAVMSQMDHSYQMCNVKVVKGNKPMIEMSLTTRSFRKTLVSNIECYGIILAEFIKLCKKGAAASTKIVTLRNQNRKMLQIQGYQVRFLYNLLTETYKIPPKCISGLELAKYGKKHKKHKKMQIINPYYKCRSSFLKLLRYDIKTYEI